VTSLRNPYAGRKTYEASHRVGINTIRAWLGHDSIATTNVYAEVDLEMKAKALAACDTGGKGTLRKLRFVWLLMSMKITAVGLCA